MNQPSIITDFKIELLQLYGCYLGTKTIEHLIARADYFHPNEVILLYVDTLLFALDNSLDSDTWNEIDTVWEMMASQGIDYIEIPADMCCQNENCINRKN